MKILSPLLIISVQLFQIVSCSGDSSEILSSFPRSHKRQSQFYNLRKSVSEIFQAKFQRSTPVESSINESETTSNLIPEECISDGDDNHKSYDNFTVKREEKDQNSTIRTIPMLMSLRGKMKSLVDITRNDLLKQDSTAAKSFNSQISSNIASVASPVETDNSISAASSRGRSISPTSSFSFYQSFLSRPFKVLFLSGLRRIAKKIYKGYFSTAEDPRKNNREMMNAFVEVTNECFPDIYNFEDHLFEHMDKADLKVLFRDRVYSLLDKMTHQGLHLEDPSENCWFSMLHLCSIPYGEIGLMTSDLNLTLRSSSFLPILENCASASSMSLDMRQIEKIRRSKSEKIMLVQNALSFESLVQPRLRLKQLQARVTDKSVLDFLTASLKAGVKVEVLSLSFRSLGLYLYGPILGFSDDKIDSYLDYGIPSSSIKNFVSSLNRSFTKKLELFDSPSYLSRKLAMLRPCISQFMRISMLSYSKGAVVSKFIRAPSMTPHFNYFELDILPRDKEIYSLFDVNNRFAFKTLLVRLSESNENQVEMFNHWIKNWVQHGTRIKHLDVIFTDHFGSHEGEIDDVNSLWNDCVDLFFADDLFIDTFAIRDERLNKSTPLIFESLLEKSLQPEFSS